MRILLQNTKIDKNAEKDFKNFCSNWQLLSQHINHLTNHELLCFIKLEKQNLNRTHILQRLYSRFSKLRRNQELKELFQ